MRNIPIEAGTNYTKYLQLALLGATINQKFMGQICLI